MHLLKHVRGYTTAFNFESIRVAINATNKYVLAVFTPVTN
jgi:hypothetical protein